MIVAYLCGRYRHVYPDGAGMYPDYAGGAGTFAADGDHRRIMRKRACTLFGFENPSPYGDKPYALTRRHWIMYILMYRYGYL